MPEVSVVSAVYNAGPRFFSSVQSILDQVDVDFEFIIVDDGSTDETVNSLSQLANQNKIVKVFTKRSRGGLTGALIKGCAEAAGDYILRHDFCDTSLPGRLKKQLAFIKQHPQASFASCGTRFRGPEDEHLYDVIINPDEGAASLLSLDSRTNHGPSSHPSTIFSRSTYNAIGGYRSSFYFAQDLDLWMRMVEHGTHLTMTEILYEAQVSSSSISGVFRREQEFLRNLILKSAQLRRAGRDDTEVLRLAAQIRPPDRTSAFHVAMRSADAQYFIGACLRKQGNPSARKYFRQALNAYPLHLKSLLRMIFS